MGVWDHINPNHLAQTFHCDRCEHEATGYQMGELVVDHGWRLHSTGVGRPCFVLCGDCEAEFEDVWQERKAA